MSAILAVLFRLVQMPFRYCLNLMLLCYDTSMDFIGLNFGLTTTDRREQRIWKNSVKEMEFREKIVSSTPQKSEPEILDRGEVINHLFEMNRSGRKLEHASSDETH